MMLLLLLLLLLSLFAGPSALSQQAAARGHCTLQQLPDSQCVGREAVHTAFPEAHPAAAAGCEGNARSTAVLPTGAVL
jgi:hypothetical protein